MSKSQLSDFSSTSEKELPQSASSDSVQSPTKGKFHRKGKGGLHNLPGGSGSSSFTSDKGLDDTSAGFKY